MPYAEGHRLEMDAKRKRLARQARGMAASSDFTFWFRECVDELPPLSRDDRVWSSRLAAMMPYAVESDRTLRRYYDGDIRLPRPDSAYTIGWALHDTGLRWCSGPIALAAAGYSALFFGLLAQLSSFGEPVRHAALRLALATYRVNSPIRNLKRVVLSNQERGNRMHDIAVSAGVEIRRVLRNVVFKASREREAIEDAWASLDSVNALRKAAPHFQLALDIVTSTRCSEALRIAVAINVLAVASLDGQSEAEFSIAEKLQRYIPRISTWRSIQ